MKPNITFQNLSDHHANQIEVFKSAQIQAWNDTIQQEIELLSAYECTKTTAPYFVFDEIGLLWADYDEVWGNSGRLIEELSRRHSRDMAMLIKKIDEQKKYYFMNVICLNEDAFFALVNAVLDYAENRRKDGRDWVSREEAMLILNIKSKTTLQRLRDEGQIEFSQIGRKLIQYKIKSLFEYLEKHKRETF